MQTVGFDGVKFAAQLEQNLKNRVESWKKAGGRVPKVVSLVFENDPGSRLYTQHKMEAAGRLGIELEPIWASFGSEQVWIEESIQTAANEQTITGLMIQKPSRKVWQNWLLSTGGDSTKVNELYSQWWHNLVSRLNPDKDIDGLHPLTQQAIADGNWQAKKKFLPATAAAVLLILHEAQLKRSDRIIILGRSELLGRPLYYVLQQQGYSVELIGTKEFIKLQEANVGLRQHDIVVAATGNPGVITEQMIKPGAVVIDVGEPKAEFAFGSPTQARFFTPVPGGVGPVTVISLLANALECVKIQAS